MHRILIIDDEETLLKNIGDFLTVKGYKVFTSNDGRSGLKFVESENPHLLILDLHLKEGPSGVQVLRLAKMIRPELKVIMFTGFGEEDSAKENCMSLGANAFLSKPTSLKSLTETVENLLETE